MKKLFLFFFIVHCALIIENCMCQWVQMTNGIPTTGNAMSLASIGNTIFTAYNNYGLGVYKTTNNGLSWTQTSLTYRFVYSLCAKGSSLLAGTDSGIYITSNNGISWDSFLNDKRIPNIIVNGNTIFAATNINGVTATGVFKSTNNGIDWNQTTLNNQWVYSLAVFNNKIFAGTTSGLFVSSDNGLNWISIPNTFGTALSFAISGNKIFAGIENYPANLGGIRVSSDTGATWTYTSFQQTTVFALTSYNNKLFAGTSSSGIFYSSNQGVNWTAINQGLPTTTVRKIYILNNYIFAATASTSIWRRPLSDIIGVHKISESLPAEYSLFQNYPNPFNPVTIIKYMISENEKWKNENGIVTLKVCDILGKEVATLVNEKQAPGVYEVTFDGTNYPSGVYFYKLTAGDFSEFKKMLLIK